MKTFFRNVINRTVATDDNILSKCKFIHRRKSYIKVVLELYKDLLNCFFKLLYLFNIVKLKIFLLLFVYLYLITIFLP